MKSDRPIQINMGYGALREKTLEEIVWLWRSGELPAEATYLDDDGDWRGLDELIEPIIAAENQEQKFVATEMDDVGDGGDRPRAWRGFVSKRFAIGALVAGIPLIFAPLWWQWWQLARQRHTAQPAANEYERNARIEDLVDAHQVVRGMSEEQVARSWGTPRLIVTAALPPGVDAQWQYRKGTVSFSKGVVMSVTLKP